VRGAFRENRLHLVVNKKDQGTSGVQAKEYSLSVTLNRTGGGRGKNTRERLGGHVSGDYNIWGEQGSAGSRIHAATNIDDPQKPLDKKGKRPKILLTTKKKGSERSIGHQKNLMKREAFPILAVVKAGKRTGMSKGGRYVDEQKGENLWGLGEENLSVDLRQSKKKAAGRKGGGQL